MNYIQKINLIVLLIITSSLQTFASSTDECVVNYKKDILHFADEHDPKNRLLTINYKDMELLKTEKIDGSLNHHADVMGTLDKANYMMMVPKGSNFVTIRDIKSGNFVKKIRLPFQPRSADAYNKTHNLMLLTARNRPSAVLIDTTSLKLVGKAGFNISCNQPNIRFPYKGLYAKDDIQNLQCTTSDFGGDQISGHPIWLNSKAFVILDRSNRLLHVYKIKKNANKWETHLIQTIKTNTALHQIIPKNANSRYNKTFYGMTESTNNGKKISGVYKFRLVGSRLIKTKFKKLNYRYKTQGINGHNLYITPDKRYLYAPVGATLKDGKVEQGGVFILSASTLRIKKFIKTGFGAGHVAFSKQRGIAIVTNHKDKFLSAINYKRHRFIQNIPLNFKSENIFSLYQSHSQHIDPNGDFYYNFWTDGGVFFRLNLETLKVDKSVYTGGIPIQGNFYTNIAINCNIPAPAKEDGYDELFQPSIQPRGAVLRRAVPSTPSINSNSYDDLPRNQITLP